MDELKLGGQLTLESLGKQEQVMPSALSAGVDKMQANFQRAGSVLANATGAEDKGRTLEQMAEKNEEEWRRYVPDVASYKDINSLGTLASYVGSNLALEAPHVMLSVLGRVGLAASAVSMFGETVNEQIHRGEDVNYTRALITGGLEGALNLPLNRAFGKTMKTLDKTSLSPEQKKSVMREMLEGIGTDGGTNGVQQILREYGVEGEFSMKDLDEAMIGGIISASPIRLGQAVASKANQAKVAKEGADQAIQSGDVTKADNFVNQSVNFMVGTALRPVRRIKNTEAGKAVLTRINEMRINNDLTKAGWTTEIQQIFKGSKLKPDEIRKRYAEGDRSLPEFQKLQSVLGDIHTRANSKVGADLKTGKIANWLPTRMDKTDFTASNQKNLLLDYINWYKQQPNKDGLRTPKEAKASIDQFAKKLENETDGASANLSRVKVDSNGDVVSSAGRKQGDTPLKQGQLEHSRTLGFIPQKILNNYALESNFQEQLLSYAQGAAHRITYAEQLGKDNQTINQLVAQANKELKEQGSQPLTRAEVDNIYNSLEAYQGTYGRFQSEVGARAASIIRSASNIVALPLTTLSSLTEPFNLAIKVGNVGAGKAFIKALGTMSQDVLSWSTNGVVPKTQVAKQLALTGRAFADATTALNARIEGQHLTTLEQNINKGFFHLTGQTTINYLVNSMAVHALDGQVRSDIMTMATPNDGSRIYADAKARLNEMGISDAQALAMHNDPIQLKQRMPELVAKFNHDVALKPDAFDKPVWQSTGWGATFTQLRGYPTMFSNTVLPKLLPLIDPRGKTNAEIATQVGQFALTTGAILTVGFLQESAKNELRGNNQSDEEIFAKAVRNTLTPIHASYILDIATGDASRVVLPASVSIVDQQLKLLQRAVNGDADLEELPVLSAFKGVL
ncbi:coil containing protein [Vibrio phage 1.262.O._10N.286.51.A9]|nr:coil containing protein [Vibrio phage 1.262.O._10N.286.51.A9]